MGGCYAVSHLYLLNGMYLHLGVIGPCTLLSRTAIGAVSTTDVDMEVDDPVLAQVSRFLYLAVSCCLSRLHFSVRH